MQRCPRTSYDGGWRPVRAGVRIAYGTDAGVYPHGWNARQLPYMVRHGMTPMAALRSATVVAAELLGWEDRVGSLTPGRYADLIAVPGDPLEDLACSPRCRWCCRAAGCSRRRRGWRNSRARLSASAPYLPA